MASVIVRATAASPAAPATNDGFTESTAIRSFRRRMALSTICAFCAFCGHEFCGPSYAVHVSLEHQARDIAGAVRTAGGRALCVGGFVRDRLLGRPSKDLDMEVFGIPAQALLALLQSLGRVEPVGQAFPVYKFGDADVALPRRESKTGRGHKGFTVAGDPSMSFEEAARRRDFTINAIGWDPLTDEYLDPFDGRTDLERRTLRVVDRQTF
ncbi:MAG: CCA tRNA nucleotidyltransferase, partial [Acidimicrobiia bacterium]|nr:CCA tRNA nucleotidyltransferase [Acidimicrobiia bacterium]